MSLQICWQCQHCLWSAKEHRWQWLKGWCALTLVKYDARHFHRYQNQSVNTSKKLPPLQEQERNKGRLICNAVFKFSKDCVEMSTQTHPHLCFWWRSPTPPAAQTVTAAASWCSLAEVLLQSAAASSPLHGNPQQTAGMSPPGNKYTAWNTSHIHENENSRQFVYMVMMWCGAVMLREIVMSAGRNVSSA